MPIITDSRYTGALVGDLRPLPEAPTPPPEPTTLDTLAAAARQITLAGAAQGRGWFDKSNLIQNLDPEVVDPTPPGFDPLDNVKGYEEFAKQFIHDTSPEQVAQRKRQIDRERADREVLSRSGAFGVGAQLVFGALDPSFLVVAGVPELALFRAGRLARAAQAAGSGAAAASVYEVGMQNLQETRTPLESAVSVGGAALISGVLGALGRSVPKKELDNLVNVTERDTAPRNPNPDDQSFGAAGVAPTTLARESFAGGGDTFSKVAGLMPFETDLQKVMKAESTVAHTVFNDLADVTGTLGRHLEGDINHNGAPVEVLAQLHEGRVADLSNNLGENYQAYRAAAKERGETPLSNSDFQEAVAKASRRDDAHPIPEVAKSAEYLRSRVFEPLKKMAQALKLLPADGEISIFAKSYFKRMYDRTQIRNNRGAWDDLLKEHFKSKGLEDAEAASVAEQITRSILGKDAGVSNFHVPGTVGGADSLTARTLDIADDKIEGFLVNDPVKVAAAYVRDLAPQIEMTKRFGDKDMKDALDKVHADYEIKRAAVDRTGPKANERINKLTDDEAETIKAITRVRDRIYGRIGEHDPNMSAGKQNLIQGVRGWRNLVASAKLGGVAITGGVQDLARITAQYGFAPTMKQLAKLVASPEFRALSKANARRIGAATEVAMKNRMHVATDGAFGEGWTSKLAELTYRMSGLNHATDFYRTLAATLIEDKILGAAAKVAAGEQLPKALLTHMAELNLDESALRQIARRASKHGTADEIRTSGSLNWTDGKLAQAYDAAILKETRNVVMTPGAADRSWLLDGEVGKTLFQIKSFAIASPVRYTQRAVQLAGTGRWGAAARYTGYMMIGGYLSHSLRQIIAGKEPVTQPAAAAQEAWAESGFGGLTSDMISPIGRRFNWFGESSRYADRNAASAFGGPAVGAFFDAYDMAYNRTKGGVSANDLQALRRLLPFQNLWWLRRGINALQGEAAEAMDLQGADHLTFAERVAQTTPLPVATQRGGTGTGLPAQ